MKRTQCEHVNERGTRCARSAVSGASGKETCTVHSPGYVRKPRAAKVAQLPPPEAMHGAEVMDPRAPCGDVHDEFNACRVCDVARVEVVDRDVKPENIECFEARGVRLYHCDHETLAALLRARGERVDATIVDAPYSERTHTGHDGGAAQANGDDARWTRSNGRVEAKITRRDIDYAHWSKNDVDAFVATWSPLTAGWVVSLTDDELFRDWRAALAAQNRQTFQDVPAIIRGMSVRLVGDGASSWGIHIAAAQDEGSAVHIATARPRLLTMSRWGTLDGGYVGPSERQPVVGGKPLWLMRALVRDYTRPGDLVCDPCAGGGTTLLAAALEGRRAIGAEPMREHFDIACRRLAEMPMETKAGQLALLANG